MVSFFNNYARLRVMKYKIYIYVFLFCLILSKAAFAENKTVRLGAILPLTGPGAFWGESIRKGIELGVREVNASGGIAGVPLEVRIEPFNYSDLKTVASAANKLIAVDKVKFLLTTWSEDTEIVVPIATRNGIPIMTIAAGAKDISQKSKLLFRIWPSDEAFVNREVDYALANNKKKAAIVAAQTAYFLSLKNMTGELWHARTGSTPFVVELKPSETDFNTICTKLRMESFDVLFLHIPIDQIPNFLIQATKNGLTMLKIGTQQSDDPSVLSVAGKSAEGLIFPAYESSSAEFKSKHEEAFGKQPGVAAEYGYDAVRIIAKAMNSSEAQTEDIIKALLNIKDFAGASGLITFNQNRDRLPKRVLLKRIVGSQSEEVKM